MYSRPSRPRSGTRKCLLTPTLQVGIDTGWTQRSRNGFSSQAGPEMTSLNLKTLVYENDPHETVSASFAGVLHIQALNRLAQTRRRRFSQACSLAEALAISLIASLGFVRLRLRARSPPRS